MIEEQLQQINDTLKAIHALLDGRVNTQATTPAAPTTSAKAPPAPPATGNTPTPPAPPAAPSTPSAPEVPAADNMSLQDAQMALNKEMQRIGKPDPIIALVAEYGVQRLNDLDPSKYAEVIAKAQQLPVGA